MYIIYRERCFSDRDNCREEAVRGKKRFSCTDCDSCSTLSGLSLVYPSSAAHVFELTDHPSHIRRTDGSCRYKPEWSLGGRTVERFGCCNRPIRYVTTSSKSGVIQDTTCCNVCPSSRTKTSKHSYNEDGYHLSVTRFDGR